jgi:hypothetical protein
VKPGRVYARELVPALENLISRDGPPLIGPSLVSVPLRRRTQTPGAGQRVTVLTHGKGPAPNVWLLRPTLPVLLHGPFRSNVSDAD